MNMLVKAALSAALLVGTSLNALAVERGGILKYGRYADSLFLDPVLNDANVDIWILSNLYDTLILPTDDGKGLKPGLATEWKVSDDGLTRDADTCATASNSPTDRRSRRPTCNGR